MINVLYVGGKEVNITVLSGMNVNLDYVQNGMIALSAIQTDNFDAVIIEDQLPLMTPTRLIQELTNAQTHTPVICVVRSEQRKRDLVYDFEFCLFNYF